jgi:hypothetical protein
MQRYLSVSKLLSCAILLATGSVSFPSCQAQGTENPNARLKVFLRGYLQDPAYDYKATRYLAAFVDLKEDGIQEAIVYFTDKHSCGSGGCAALILEPEGTSYRVVTSITIARPPIRVLSDKSHGWHNLSVRVEGGGIQPGYDVELTFNGKTYPRNPTVAPARRFTESVEGRILIPAHVEGALLFQP